MNYIDMFNKVLISVLISLIPFFMVFIIIYVCIFQIKRLICQARTKSENKERGL